MYIVAMDGLIVRCSWASATHSCINFGGARSLATVPMAHYGYSRNLNRGQVETGATSPLHHHISLTPSSTRMEALLLLKYTFSKCRKYEGLWIVVTPGQQVYLQHTTPSMTTAHDFLLKPQRNGNHISNSRQQHPAMFMHDLLFCSLLPLQISLLNIVTRHITFHHIPPFYAAAFILLASSPSSWITLCTLLSPY